MPDWLRRRLEAAGGWLPWREIMALALYAPGHGYYAGAPRRVGRAGDFYTAVSVGPLYGRLLADHAAARWEALGRPEKFTLAEQGAHDGRLMADLLAALRARHPALAARAEVVVIEPQAGYREAQQRTLAAVWPGEPRWLDRVGTLEAAAGLLVCNELLDAFPVHRVRREAGTWRELGVVLREAGGLEWESRALVERAAGSPGDSGATEPVVPRVAAACPPDDLAAELERLPDGLPDGYVTEIQTEVAQWMQELGGSGFGGEVWIADYGLDATEYWSAERAEGTLRRYFKHRMDDRVLEDLGAADLTCHVNFTRLIEAAAAAGFAVLEDTGQGPLLTRLAEPWLRGLDGQPPDAETRALLRQFQTLTHPGLMGRVFRVLRLGRSTE